MIRVKVTTTFPEWPFIRQTPGSLGTWQDCDFIINRHVDECDFWVVYDGLLAPETSRCAGERIIFMAGEPPDVKRYRNEFLQQFGIIITSDQDVDHHCVLHHQQAQPWHLGINRETGLISKTYDELRSITEFPKTKLLSVVCSSKAISEGHRRRLGFLEALKVHFGSEMDMYGRGFDEIADKWDAIFPYKYHIAIENSRVPDYFTEKLTDTYLGGAYPLYCGCPNLQNYFPPDSFTEFDVSTPKKALKIIGEAVSGNTYERAQDQIRVAREVVLDTHNFFAMIARLVREYNPVSEQPFRKTASTARNRLAGGLEGKMVSPSILTGCRAASSPVSHVVSDTREIELLPEIAFVPPASFLDRALSRLKAWRARFVAS